MMDLSTTYLGLNLKNPLVASASPLSKKVEGAQRLEEAGIAAIVMYSLFEEQIIHESLELDHFLTRGSNSSAEALSYLPDTGTYALGPKKYIEHLTALKKAVQHSRHRKFERRLQRRMGGLRPSHSGRRGGRARTEPVLHPDRSRPFRGGHGVRTGGTGGGGQGQPVHPAGGETQPVLHLPAAISRNVSTEAGASGLVLFNRFYQPDFDLEALEVIPNLDLSTSSDLRLPLRWISILHGQVKADLALTSGIHTAQDALKAMMAGAKVAMMASSLLHNGVRRPSRAMLNEMGWWMQTHEYESIQQMQGSMSRQSVAEPAAFERANYMRVLNSWRELP